jgi:argininosuccinate synthase
VIICGRKSPFSIYKKELASFEEEGGYSHKDAEGFIRLNALRLKNLATF